MAQGIICRRGGGGASLAFAWVNAATFGALPSSPPENTIGFISSIPVANTPYLSNEAISGLQEGDVVLKHGSYSNARINILKKGRVDLYPSGAYQYQSGILVPIEAYLYQDGAWKRIYVLFYENNTFPAVVGDFIVQGTGTLTKNADYMNYGLSNQSGHIRSVNMVDLTRINTIYFYGGGTHATVAANMNVATTAAGASAASVNLPVASAWAWRTLATDGLSGDHYIRFGYGTSASLSIRCYIWFGLG